LIHVSLDAPTASQHDGFRRTPGAFQRAVEAIGLLQKAGLPVFSSTLVRLAWLPQADDMLRLLSRLAIRKAMFSFLVPLGRGSEIASECVPYERRSDIAATLKQAGERWNVDVECRRAHRGDDGLSGCPAGRSLLHLDAAGYVSPCPWLSKLRPELRTALPSWLEMQKIGGAGWRLPPAGEACSGDGCARASECGRGCPVETSLNSKCGRDPLCRQGTIGL
jgi:MoaA/NifB/PqqE/SkfB family radical SAM enzyme